MNFNANFDSDPTSNRLGRLYEQRRIGKTHGSLPSRLQLRTLSGPQSTESELETELVEQLNFSLHVRDLITQMILRYDFGGKERRYTADILCELTADRDMQPCLMLLEVKREEVLEKAAVESASGWAEARRWCTQNHAEFFVVTERTIRTPHLKNARALSKHLDNLPEDDHMPILRRAEKARLTVAQTLKSLTAEGIPLPFAQDAIERAVANRLVGCDLALPFGPGSILRQQTQKELSSHDSSPILRLIRGSTGTKNERMK